MLILDCSWSRDWIPLPIRQAQLFIVHRPEPSELSRAATTPSSYHDPTSPSLNSGFALHSYPGEGFAGSYLNHGLRFLHPAGILAMSYGRLRRRERHIESARPLVM